MQIYKSVKECVKEQRVYMYNRVFDNIHTPATPPYDPAGHITQAEAPVDTHSNLGMGCETL